MAAVTTRLYIALYTDADVNGKLASQIRKHGYDAVSAYEVGNAGFDDGQQIEYAIQQERAILTHNAQDFEPLYEKYWNEGREHWGIIISDQMPIGEMLRRLLRLLDSVDSGEMRNGLRHLGEFK
ncbi:MAG: hypothetical protein A2Z03_00565 [Chloroflexi bacterium RBG_16_56_8]|nr:MAG: hypothetical protein A2Z03_00565 [Chloroflexi bacterium RBG_16_56_8]